MFYEWNHVSQFFTQCFTLTNPDVPQNNRMKFILNYIHFVLYVAICVGSYYGAYTANNPLTECLLACWLGWSVYALVTIGHDCIHGSFSPYPCINDVLAFICMDMLLMRKARWKKEHSNHHADPGGVDDHMLLEGGRWWLEMKHLLAANRPHSIWDEVPKLPMVVAMCLLPLYCLPLIWLSMLLSFMYLSLSTHILDPHLRTWNAEQKKTSEDVAWNIFPQSHLYTFLAGGLNIHGCHQKNFKWTRSELMMEATQEGYHAIDTWAQFTHLLWNRT